jgi:hypothetical protein
LYAVCVLYCLFGCLGKVSGEYFKITRPLTALWNEMRAEDAVWQREFA